MALVVLAFSGCGTIAADWEWHVVRLHNLGTAQGKTFTVVPLRRENIGSAEFKVYAALLAAKLGRHGLRYLPTEETGLTDYVVGLDYGISAPQELKYNEPILGVSGGQSTYVTGVAVSGGTSAIGQLGQFVGEKTTNPTPAVVGRSSGQITYYKQYVRVVVFDGRMEAGHLVKCYDGSAVAVGEHQDLTRIVPTGLYALLQEFPGKSGQTKLVTVPAEGLTK
ncbi:MAG: hypothetical protein PSW75_04670 [bacterium]|nr:hypothetical protein [bacterium]